jgi:hypothetical protein
VDIILQVLSLLRILLAVKEANTCIEHFMFTAKSGESPRLRGATYEGRCYGNRPRHQVTPDYEATKSFVGFHSGHLVTYLSTQVLKEVLRAHLDHGGLRADFVGFLDASSKCNFFQANVTMWLTA